MVGCLDGRVCGLYCTSLEMVFLQGERRGGRGMAGGMGVGDYAPVGNIYDFEVLHNISERVRD